MSLRSRFVAAASAFRAEPASRDVVRLKAPPPAPIGPTAPGAGPSTPWSPSSPAAPRKRRRVAPLPIDRTRWLRADIEAAEHQANSGNLQRAAQIAQWCKEDLVVGGLLGTRCAVPRLPREWRGDPEARLWLQGEGARQGCFDRIFPPVELEEDAIDHFVLGAGVSLFVHPTEQEYPTLVRLDNQFLRYLPGEDRWRYQGWGKTYDITPGDGVWVLHLNGAIDPWRRGAWSALGYDQVSEDGAGLARDGFLFKFGNPFVMAVSPTGAAEEQKTRFWSGVADWVMGFAGVTPGWDVKLIEAKGEGRQVFTDAEARVERRAMIRICGQVVTTTGGVGFANAEIFSTIASHLVTRTGQDLATTLNEQAIPHVIRWAQRNGRLAAGDRSLLLSYDTTPPQAREAEAAAIKAAAEAITAMREAGLDPDLIEMAARFRLPVKALVAAVAPAVPELGAAPAEEAPSKSVAQALAEDMEEHGMTTCHCGHPNRCRVCNVERTRTVVPGVDGAPATWKLGWQAIEEPRATSPGWLA